MLVSGGQAGRVGHLHPHPREPPPCARTELQHVYPPTLRNPPPSPHLSERNYRLFAASQVLSNTGAWMQRVAQDWFVLSLSHSPTAVGLTIAAQFAPTLVFGLYGGVIADRYPRRRLLIGTQSRPRCCPPCWPSWPSPDT